jgi:hypothetical protein
MEDTEERFMCQLCIGDDKPEYTSLSDLKRHQQLTHRDRVEESCEYCNFKGANYRELISHHNCEHAQQIPAQLLNSHHHHSHNSNRPYRRRRRQNQTRNENEHDVQPEDGIICNAFNGACKYAR